MRDRSRTIKARQLPRLKGNVVVLDVETDGLDPYHGDRIFCWSYFTSKGEWGFMLKTPKSLQWVEKLLNDSSKHIVFHNAKFDLKMLSFEGIDIFHLKSDIHCTLIMSKVLNSVQINHDLRYLSKKHLGSNTADKDEVIDWIAAHKKVFTKEHGRVPNFKDAPIDIVKKRGIWDVKNTLGLFEIFYPKIRKTCPQLYDTERQLLFVCIDMENTGTLINITRAEELRDEAQQSLDRIQEELNHLICPMILRDKDGGEETVDVFNPNSSQKQLPAAFQKLGIQLRYRTKPKKNRKTKTRTGGGNWSFDEYAMLRYVSKPLASIIWQSSKENWKADKFYDVVHRTIKKHGLHRKELLPPLILKYRQLSKLISTYYNHLIEDCVGVHITPAGRKLGTLHCKFNQSEAMTGRFSSSELNLQNMPRLLGPRECFITRKGRKFWMADYSQVEMRFYIHFSKDKKMANNLKSDLHLQTAAEMYSKKPKDIIKEERERAGSVNFMVIYGAGFEKAAETLSKKGSPTTTGQAASFINKYHRTYPSVRKTSRNFTRQLGQEGYVENPFGRRYHIPFKLGYKVLNYMCQGTSADQIKKAMVDIWLWLRENNFRTKILITVHDELIFEVPHSEESKVIPVIIQLMEDLKSYFVPITVGLEVAPKRWSEKTKAKELSLQWLTPLV